MDPDQPAHPRMDPDQTAQMCRSGTMLVENALCWFCRAAAQLSFKSKNKFLYVTVHTASIIPDDTTPPKSSTKR
jgi:hypothetical protein